MIQGRAPMVRMQSDGTYGVFAEEGENHIRIFLPATFTMLDYECVVEPLRLVNKLCRRAVFGWSLVTIDGEPVHATNGAVISGAYAISNFPKTNTLVILGPHDPVMADGGAVIGALRKLHRHGTNFIALDNGAYFLARAGLLSGRRATLHWEVINAFKSEFGDVQIEDARYIVDGSIITGCGGIPTLDVMCHLIEQWVGPDMALAVARICIYDVGTGGRERQLSDHRKRLGTSDQLLIRSIAIMENEIETPLRIGEIADRIGLSRRQLERMFQKEIEDTPASYYLSIRLAKAREMVKHTKMTIAEIAGRCGFQSNSQFAKSYRNQHGTTPIKDRRQIAE